MRIEICAMSEGVSCCPVTTNTVNQYVRKYGALGYNILGTAHPGSNVVVNGSSVNYRRGEYFWKWMSVTNSTSPRWLPVEVTSGSQTNTGNVFMPGRPELFTYDLDGNMLSDGRWNYTWDAENRLTSMTVNTNVGPQLQLDFKYDWMGRRISKTVKTNGVTSYSRKFLYDGWNLIAELDGTNSLVRSYTWGVDASGSMQGAGGVGGLLMVNAGSGGVHFPAYDLNGNVMGLVNAANGNISAKYEYGPFGEVFCSVGDMAKVNPFQFSTKYTDNETDLLYYGYRYYSPALGRWMSRDPLGEPGFENTSNRPKNKSPRKKREDFLLGRIRSINPILAEEFRTKLAKLDVTDADSKERQNAVNLYAFIGNDPLTHYDYLGLIKVCTRPLEGLKCTTVIVHCYLDLGNGQTYSYDPNGIHADPNPNSPKKRCVDVSPSTITARDVMNQVMSDLASQQWMGGMCPAGDYTFTGHNCCHWVDHVLTSLGSGGVEGYFPGYSLP